jgi:orotate phosphoribosyltransferase
MNIANTIAKALLDIKAVKISIDPPFTWASGIKSPIYCDNRMLVSHPGTREVIVDAFCQMVQERGADYVAGTATAGIPWTAFVAQKLNMPMVYVRPEPKGHGAGKQIEGDLPLGKKVVMIEDLISTGGSSIKTAVAIKNEGQCEITDVLAIVTYQFKRAEENFKEAGLNPITLTDFSHLVSEARHSGALTESQVAQVLEFSQKPQEWWDSFSK